ncbi:MAG: hypothetical protein MUD12_15135 [Spirochaetes bacterium]|jgi:hypothetical protein|nr:hypothetical protein [Spirochaetota bacterium]
MEAARYIKKIESSSILIEGLDRFAGQEVEIIILSSENRPSNLHHKENLYGVLNGYADNAKISAEKQAWESAAQEKHEKR